MSNRYFEWRDSMTVYDATIDSQHKQLLEQINSLIVALEAVDSSSALQDILKFLDACIFKHLYYEEALLRSHKFPQIDEHIKLHAGFISYYDDYKKSVKNSEDKSLLAIQAKSFLLDWWLNHIGVEDKKWAEYIRKTADCHPDKETKDFHTKKQQ